MNPKDQLLRMLRIQELALEAARASKVIDDAPGHIEEIEQRFRDRNVEYVALKDRYDELQRDQREREGELADLEEQKGKYTAALMQVQNQREYAATLKEIDTVKARIAEHEDVILKAMEEMESLKPQLDEFADRINEERRQVEEERREVEARVAKAQDDLASARKEREAIEAELPPGVHDNIRRIEDLRGLFLVKVEDGLCQACYVRIRPQAAQEIRLAAAVHTCSQCRRFLYDEQSLRPPEDERPPRESDSSSGVEAVNGGAV